jgi:hypothetical protein
LTVYGCDRLKRISESLKLPDWWVEFIVIEHFPCRRFGEKGKLWTFDFNLLTENMIRNIPNNQVIIPNFFLIQNVRPRDFSVRIVYGATGNAVAPLDQIDLIPEGMANSSCFPFGIQSIELLDPKLGFSERAIALDENIFYQWKIADFTQSSEQKGRFKWDPMNLDKLSPINEKLVKNQKPEILDNATQETIENIAKYYEKLEEIRNGMRTKILGYHNIKKKDYDISKYDVPFPPLLSVFDTLKLNKEKDSYLIKTQIHALFYRSSLRNLEKSLAAREEGKYAQKEHDALLDELEYSAMCIISSVACLESYINFVIEEYVPEESKKC